MVRKVAIIGAGVSGLTALKSALESGLEATAFERDSQIGGLWNCHIKTVAGHSCVQSSTVTNTSKNMTGFSDFPMPKDWSNFLRVPKMMEYLRLYAERFDLMKRINFNTTILEIKKSSHYEEKGEWEILYRTKNGELKSEIFDAVLVCTGINSKPHIPNIPGQEGYTGTILHSMEYHTFHPFEGKRVLVVGGGNTAADISCELSRVAAQVYMSIRSGLWIASRLVGGGFPFDVAYLRRVMQLIPQCLLGHLMKYSLEKKCNHANLGLESDKLPDQNLPIINDELPHRIVTGSVIMKSEIEYLKERTVFFSDGSRVDDIDAIILGTGFEVKVPTLPEYLQPRQEIIPFYKYVFPPALKVPTLAVIGAIRVRGPIPPIVELQARWAIQVFTRKCSLPSAEDMQRDVEMTTAAKLKKFGFTKLCNSVTFVSYADEISSFFGAKPNLRSLLLEDPYLALKCYFGPCVPAQYRLKGPGSWHGAKDVIYSVHENVLAPLRTRKVEVNNPSYSFKWKVAFTLLFVLFFVYLVLS